MQCESSSRRAGLVCGLGTPASMEPLCASLGACGFVALLSSSVLCLLIFCPVFLAISERAVAEIG